MAPECKGQIPCLLVIEEPVPLAVSPRGLVINHPCEHQDSESSTASIKGRKILRGKPKAAGESEAEALKGCMKGR
ncbi:hypothetical protein NL676_006250 [Syzygium grande]|nr:hypothetical protein NL676_006250 [Syzygium grande]